MFERDDFKRMAGQLAAIKGSFILSINDTPDIRAAFGEFIIDEVRLTYFVGRDAAKKKARELIISNRSVAAGLL